MEDKLTLDFKTMQLIIKKISFIDTFRGRWTAIEQKENRYLNELKFIATIESIGSSTRIEGASLTNEEISNLLKSIKISKLKSRDEQEVIGYYQCLDTVLDNYKDIRLSESYIKQLHGILLKHSGKDERHRGAYKSVSNKVIAHYPGGKQGVIFNTTEPALVQKEMETLIRWTNEAFEIEEIHPLLVIAAFIYEFLSIHPFQDGNGRLSRLLTTWLLLEKGYHFVQYISFESLIEERKKDYYKALMAGQRNRYKKAERIDQWLVFFFEGISSLIRKLEVKYDQYARKGSYLNARQKKLLSVISKIEPARLGDIRKALPRISPNTIKKDLLYLVAENRLSKLGQRKGTVYFVYEDIS
jgi:Fic family protein